MLKQPLMTVRLPQGRWLGRLALAAGLLLTRPAHAQTAADSAATAPADSSGVGGGGGLAPPPGGLPSSEFETYNMDGTGGHYTAALTGLLSTGTVERVYFSTNHTANFSARHWQFPTAVGFSYGRQSGAVREREWLLLTTPDYRLGRWKFYGLTELESSNLRAIAYRLVLGGGLGYQLYADSARNEVALSTFLLDEDTRYNTEPALVRHLARSSTRLKLRLSRGPVSGAALLFYQPALRDPAGDYRLNNSTVLAVKLYQHLALNLAYTFSYESVVVQDRSRANSTLSVGFAYSTGK